MSVGSGTAYTTPSCISLVAAGHPAQSGPGLTTSRQSISILHDADKDQGGFGAAEGASQQLTVLREAAGFGMMILQDAGRDQGGWSVADGPTLQLAVLLGKYGNDDST